MYHIREAMFEDIPALCVQLKAFSDHHSTKLPPYKDQETSELILKGIMANHLFYVAVTEDTHELVGFIAGYVVNHPFNPDIITLVEAFWWVDPKHRKSGVGIQLLDAYENWGKKNVDWITMTIEEETPIPHELFLSRGFRKKETAFIMEVI